MKTLFSLITLLPTLALAHEGHGMEGSAHWHATDTLGFVGVAVVAVLVWFIGKGK